MAPKKTKKMSTLTFLIKEGRVPAPPVAVSQIPKRKSMLSEKGSIYHRRTFTIPFHISDALDAEIDASGMTGSDLVTEALKAYLT